MGGDGNGRGIGKEPKNGHLFLRICCFLWALMGKKLRARRVVREMGQKSVHIHHFLYINKSALIQQIFRILKALPRLDLICIQFFDIDYAGTCSMFSPLQFQPIFVLHLDEGRPYSLMLLWLVALSFILLRHPSVVAL